MNEAGVEVAAAVHTLDLMEFTCTQTSRRTPSPHLNEADVSMRRACITPHRFITLHASPLMCDYTVTAKTVCVCVYSS